jgi:cellulose synthase/poly-beta-1,6-N-acetylglucosamine synthase-like glycosyltransferase
LTGAGSIGVVPDQRRSSTIHQSRAQFRPSVDVPRLTFLVAAWNEADNISGFIDSFYRLDFAEKELVLCAGGSDATYERAIELRRDSVKVLFQRRGEGKQAALRKGLRSATGDVIVLADADSVLSTDAVAKLVAPILSGDETVTTGISRPKASQLSNTFVLYQYALQLVGQRRIERSQYRNALLGRNCAVLRSVLDEVGGFREDVWTGTDSFLGRKLVRQGHRIRFVPESVVETDYETKLWEYCRQRSRWTRNGIVNSVRFRLYRRLVKALVPSLIGLGVFGLPLISIWLGGSLLYLWGALMALVYVRHVTYVATFLQSQQRPLSAAILARLALYMWAEWAAHVLALFQLPAARLRRSW